MPSLSDVLSEAASHDAFEVIMETGQPVLMNTKRGGVPVGSELSEDDLFAALTAVLDQEQQVELMVGNVIEFTVTAKGDWHVVTEPGRDGITIRARIAGAIASAKAAAGPSIDLPPVAPFSGGGVNLPPVAEDSFSNLRLGNPTPDGVEAADLASEFDSPDSASDSDPSAGDSFADLGFDMPSAEADTGPAPDLSADPDGEAPSALDPLDPLTLDEEEEDDDLQFDLEDDDEPGADFAMVDAPAPDPAPSASDEAAAAKAKARADMLKTRDLGPALADVAHTEAAKHESATRLNLVPPPASPVADTRSDLGTVSDRTPPVHGTFAQVAAQVPVTGLTLVHGADADDVAAALDCESVLVDHAASFEDAAASLHDLPPGSVAVLRVEDPSRWLAWCLRRLEEGYGVLVETRALSPGGAKRSLLGPGATVRAESWLGRHVVRSLIETEGVWTLLLPQ